MAGDTNVHQKWNKVSKAKKNISLLVILSGCAVWGKRPVQESLLRQTLEAKVLPCPLTNPQHFQGSRQHSGARAALSGSSRGCTHTQCHLLPTQPWPELHTFDICTNSKTTALVEFWLPKFSSVQLGHLSRVLATHKSLCTGGITTGTYRFQQHTAPPDCTSAFKERADIWASWPRALEDESLNTLSSLQSDCSQVAIKILHDTAIPRWRQLYADFIKGLRDKSASLIPKVLCLPSREIREKMLSSQESEDGNAGDDKCSWFCSLCVGKILHEGTRPLAAGKGCGWESVVPTWEMSEAGQAFQGCVEPQIQSTRTESHPASWHPHWQLASLCSTTSVVHANKQGYTATSWKSRICQIVVSPSLASKRCYSGNSSLFTSKAPIFIRPVLPRLGTQSQFKVHWMPLWVLQLQQNTAGDILPLYRYQL